MDLLRIDGSYGEGGGQILRTSLALSVVLSRPVEIYNIRKGRKKGGLQPQHLTCVNAAKEIGNARVEGNTIGSMRLVFIPSTIRGGRFIFDVAELKGSAGSTSLVLQSILLPLCFAPSMSEVTIKGGTHVEWSPPFHYLQDIFVPVIERMGCKVRLSIEKWGWYPLGGGLIYVMVEPVEKLSGIELMERGRLLRIRGLSAVSNLPLSIGERQKNRAMELLRGLCSDIDIPVISAPASGKGTFFFIMGEYEHIRGGFTSPGAPGKPAEKVAEETVESFIKYHKARGAVDPHLADQLIPFMALAQGPSSFTTSLITRHLLTNIWTVKQFIDLDIKIQGEEGREGKIYINPKASGG